MGEQRNLQEAAAKFEEEIARKDEALQSKAAEVEALLQLNEQLRVDNSEVEEASQLQRMQNNLRLAEVMDELQVRNATLAEVTESLVEKDKVIVSNEHRNEENEKKINQLHKEIAQLQSIASESSQSGQSQLAVISELERQLAALREELDKHHYREHMERVASSEKNERRKLQIAELMESNAALGIRLEEAEERNRVLEEAIAAQDKQEVAGDADSVAGPSEGASTVTNELLESLQHRILELQQAKSAEYQQYLADMQTHEAAMSSLRAQLEAARESAAEAMEAEAQERDSLMRDMDHLHSTNLELSDQVQQLRKTVAEKDSLQVGDLISLR